MSTSSKGPEAATKKKTRQRETICSAREQICSHNKLDRTMSMQRIQEKYYLLPSGNGSSNSSSSWPLFLLLLQLRTMATGNSKAKQARNAAVLKDRQTDRQTAETVPKMRGKKTKKTQKSTRSVRQRRGGLIDNRPQETMKRCDGSGTQHQISSHCRRANNNNKKDQNANKKTAQETQEQRRENPHTPTLHQTSFLFFYCSKKQLFINRYSKVKL